MKYHYLSKGFSWHTFFISATVIITGLLLYQPVSASYSQLTNYYDWGPYYNNLPTAIPGAGKVLQATTTAEEVNPDLVITGWIEAYPNPDAPTQTQYFIGVEGQGLVEIGPDQIPTGLDISQLVGQYTALGTVEDERILAPVPPPTDAALQQKASDSSADVQPPPLPSPGTSRGFLHSLEIFGENIWDGSLNLITPGRAPERTYRRVTERAAEAQQLIQDQHPAANAAVQRVEDTLHELFDRYLDEEVTRQFEEQIAGLQITIDQNSATIPEDAETDFNALSQAAASGVDQAADKLDKPAVTAGVVQGLQSLKSIGVLQQEQADHIYSLDTRQAVRDVFEEFAANGYITPADIKGALYPQQIRSIIELDKVNSLSRFEGVRPDDATLAKLESFSATFVPGVTMVPPDLLPYWVATVNLDRLQQTMRPDYIPPETLSAMEQHRPNAFAKYKELEYRFKPSPNDIAALEQYKAQLRDQFKDDATALANIDNYLPPQMQRIAGFHERFGLKDPEGWQKPEGLKELPFAGPGGLRDINAIEKYCSSNDCSNYTSPSGYALKPPVNVGFKPEEKGRPPVFPGMTSFRPPVPVYNILPQTPAQYVGHNGCTNPADCLKAFREIPPAERASNFFLFQAPPPGLAVERRFDPAKMTGEEKKEYEAALQRGEINSDGTPKIFQGNAVPVNPQGQPVPGPGAMYNPDGSFNTNFRASSYIPNQNNYSTGQPGAYMPGAPYRPDGAMDSGYRPPSSTGGVYNPGVYQSMPTQNSSGPYYPSYTQPMNQPPPNSGTGSYYTPPTNEAPGGDVYNPPPAGQQAPPPPDNGGNFAPPPNDGEGNPPPPPADSGEGYGGGGDFAPPPGGDGGGGEPAPAPDGGGDGGYAPPPT